MKFLILNGPNLNSTVSYTHLDVYKRQVVLSQNRAAYQGVEGAFAHIALRALFPHAEAVSYPTWDEVFEDVYKRQEQR